MIPWLIGFLVLVGILALAWMGGKLVESRSAQWEEDQIRLINDELPTEIDPEWLIRRRLDPGCQYCGMPTAEAHAEWCDKPAPGWKSDVEDLPANWQDQDSRDSYFEAIAEMRRKTGGA